MYVHDEGINLKAAVGSQLVTSGLQCWFSSETNWINGLQTNGYSCIRAPGLCNSWFSRSLSCWMGAGWMSWEFWDSLLNNNLRMSYMKCSWFLNGSSLNCLLCVFCFQKTACSFIFTKHMHFSCILFTEVRTWRQSLRCYKEPGRKCKLFMRRLCLLYLPRYICSPNCVGYVEEKQKTIGSP